MVNYDLIYKSFGRKLTDEEIAMYITDMLNECEGMYANELNREATLLQKTISSFVGDDIYMLGAVRIGKYLVCEVMDQYRHFIQYDYGEDIGT